MFCNCHYKAITKLLWNAEMSVTVKQTALAPAVRFLVTEFALKCRDCWCFLSLLAGSHTETIQL